MKLIVFVSRVDQRVAQWHHYFMQILPGRLDNGCRYMEKPYIAYPKHPAIRRLAPHEHLVSQTQLITLFDEAIKAYDPDATAHVIVAIHNLPYLYETQTLRVIKDMLERYPEIKEEDVRIVPVVEGMPVTTMPHTLSEFIHSMHEDE